LSRTVSQPFDDLARPLSVESGGVHYHHPVIAPPPGNRNDDSMPKRPDASMSSGIHLLGMVPAQHFVAQGWAERPTHTIHGRSNQRNLRAAQPRQLRQPRIVVHAQGLLRGFLHISILTPTLALGTLPELHGNIHFFAPAINHQGYRLAWPLAV